MLTEIVLNILLLFPMGLLLPIVFHGKIRWWQGALIGFGISTIIEFCQLMLCRGLFEWDDMMYVWMYIDGKVVKVKIILT